VIVGRLSILLKNTSNGMLLVFAFLALFLNLLIALWATTGLPFIFAGILLFMGYSLAHMSINEMTAFGFVLTLRIVVDDALGQQEHLYYKKRGGRHPAEHHQESPAGGCYHHLCVAGHTARFLPATTHHVGHPTQAGRGHTLSLVQQYGAEHTLLPFKSSQH
jgi:hypothetical protein